MASAVAGTGREARPCSLDISIWETGLPGGQFSQQPPSEGRGNGCPLCVPLSHKVSPLQQKWQLPWISEGVRPFTGERWSPSSCMKPDPRMAVPAPCKQPCPCPPARLVLSAGRCVHLTLDKCHLERVLEHSHSVSLQGASLQVPVHLGNGTTSATTLIRGSQCRPVLGTGSCALGECMQPRQSRLSSLCSRTGPGPEVCSRAGAGLGQEGST